MTMGLAVKNEAGENLVWSPDMSSNFFGTYAVTAAALTLPAADFNISGAALTPLSVFTIRRHSSTQFRMGSVTAAGAMSGTSYVPPTKGWIAGTASDFDRYVVLSGLSVEAVAFGQATGITEAFGGFFQGNSNQLVINQRYKTYYVHRLASATGLKTATATSLPSNIPGTIGSANSYYDQVQPMNVVFDVPLDRPPLIFIQSSGGPIAFNGMIRNVAGKYIGASIVARAYYMNGYGIGGYGSNTYSFTYFVVSEQPVGVLSSWGLRVLDAGNNIVFDSSNFVPGVRRVQQSTPYERIQSVSNATPVYASINTASHAKTSSEGVCINPFNSMTGMGTFGSLNIGTTYMGPSTFFGRYINVSPTGVTVSGGPSFALLTTAGSGFGAWSTHDFTLGAAPLIDVFFAQFTR